MARIEEAIQQRQFENIYQKVIINILFTNNWVVDIQQKVFRPFGLTYQQYNVLRILRGKHPTPYTAKGIKEVMLDKRPDLTRMLDRLQKKNLVFREIDSCNRSKLAITLTDQGCEILNRIEPELKRIYDELGALSAEEAETLSDLLDKLRS
ncbi:MAG: MarR family transcriptional regulator [Bacteroidota bacterium]